MPSVVFNRYYQYEELTKLLQAFEKEYPNLVKVESIGKSHEQRDIWLVTVTDAATGPAEEKPAFWCDGNIHASEVSASTAVLHLLNRLVTNYQKPESSESRALKTRAFYLVPRLNPDGAEWALETPPRIIRSSTRPYPYDEDDPYGLEKQDLDGDGRILNMRIPDSNGPWKISEKNPRLMERRSPGESGGNYYRLMPEGLFHNFDQMTMRGQKVKEGLDMNRNWPVAWRQEFEQKGAGDFPGSEPEILAAMRAIVNRPNICGAVMFHTFSGVNLRPPGRHPEDQMAPEDLWVYQKVGKTGEEITGYPAISVWNDFKYHPKEVITGVADDWVYEHRGAFAWTTEIWAPPRQAGIKDYKYIEWFREHPFEHEEMLLEWSDTKLEGKGYIDWYPFDHPQLGPIELGGWDGHYAFRNPPPQFLEAEVAPLGEWVVWQALGSPKLELRKVQTEAVGNGAFRIRFAVQNTGWLPTNVTKVALERKLCRGVVAEITKEGWSKGKAGSSEPDWLVGGKLRLEGPQLVGWSHVEVSGFGWPTDSTDDVALFEWVVSQPGVYHLEAKHERAGVVRHVVDLRG
ncbi:MAG: carboxypeptidase [Armatimonadetes bacterium]|nr:carboxypeptidase [Armatimonadota bacterium]